MSIKTKITLFNTLIMTVMVTLVLGFMIIVSDDIIQSSSQTRLLEEVDDNIDELEYKNGGLDYSDVDFYEDNVYISIYTIDGEYIVGENFGITEPLEDKQLKEYENYYIYDVLVDDKRFEAVWIRGIVRENDVADVLNTLFILAFITLPAFIILAGIGCNLITKKAFIPIEKITSTANDINKSKDFSLRVGIEDFYKTKDEVYNLAEVFDDMFVKIESSFDMEKQFTSDVSHELRTPTAVILAQCEVALLDETLSEDCRDTLEVVQRQAGIMQSTISNLLDLTRIDRGLENFEFTLVDLSELVVVLCDELRMISTSDIELSCEVQEKIELNIEYDLIARLVTNLINNSYRYGKDGGYIKVRLYEQDETAILEVEDDGIGISSENQEKIFDRLYQVDKSRTATLGLGLSMVQQIAKIHEAEITVKSELDKGSTFKIKFFKK